MPQHNIIDNRSEKLNEHILRILPSSEWVKFADKYEKLIVEFSLNLPYILIEKKLHREQYENINA